MPNENPRPEPSHDSQGHVDIPGKTRSYDDLNTPTRTMTDGVVTAMPTLPDRRYELGTEIARGGMGAIYRAKDTVFAREVAVKVLLDKYSPTSGTACRFGDEARITGQLQHPNIPAVHDLGVLSDGRPFLAMKLIKGETLEDQLKSGPQTSEDRGRFLAVFEQVCHGVAYAHAHNVIHRDLKPSNIMVGAFGEVQVMDWGLAKVLGTRESEATDPDVTTTPTEVLSIRQTDGALTQAGSVLGTPAYMPPEQAIGAVHKIDARSDVFGLGGILAVILTGKPPFVGGSGETTRVQAAQGNVEECFSRLDACGAEPELVALCKRCLSKKMDDRPSNAGEVAKAVAELRTAAVERARQAETERARAETRAIEQRKRRRVQLTFAGVVGLMAIAGGIAAFLVNAQREQDRLAAELAKAEATRQKERETRATSLAKSLASAETAIVPRIISELSDVKTLVRPLLAELASRPMTSKPGLHASLALLADEPQRTADLAAYLTTCKSEELLTIREALKPQAALVAPGLWTLLEDAKADIGKRVRAACALAGLAPTDNRWDNVAADVISLVVKENPLQAMVWAQALEPVRLALLPTLLKRYPELQTRIESGTLTVTELAVEAMGFDLTASLLARYTADRPAEMADAAANLDGRHLPLFFPAIQALSSEIAPRLEAEIDKTLPAELPSSDPRRETLAKRQANAAVILLRLDKPARVWPLLKHSPDPRVRSYLIHRLFPLGTDPMAIVKRLDAELELSARRALLLALGEFDAAALPPTSRTELLPKIQGIYRDHPDPGLHAAAEWLLRRWKQESWLKQINTEWVKDEPQRMKKFEEIQQSITREKEKAARQWYINTQGQTFVVLPGPVAFQMGSPTSEINRKEQEIRHLRLIGRSFAVATKSVTLEQYRRLTKDYFLSRGFSYSSDLPVVGINWYMAAIYCNQLSKEEGIPEDQWCYEIKGEAPNYVGSQLKENYLSLKGYRLPTSAECEYVARAGTSTSRFYGETETLMREYAWNMENSKDLLQPVGMKKPNDWGFFDIYGNCFNWCTEHFDRNLVLEEGETVEDREVPKSKLLLISSENRKLRGGSFTDPESYLRSSSCFWHSPTFTNMIFGFRLARTITP